MKLFGIYRFITSFLCQNFRVRISQELGVNPSCVDFQVFLASHSGNLEFLVKKKKKREREFFAR